MTLVPFTYAVFPLKIFPSVASASEVNVPDTPKIVIPDLMLPATILACSELAIPIVALCQVARDAEGQKPNLAQLRGSGSIEQDADVVMFLHRDRLKEEVAAQDAEIILAKQRNGATGDIPIIFLPTYSKFEGKVEE